MSLEGRVALSEDSPLGLVLLQDMVTTLHPEVKGCVHPHCSCPGSLSQGLGFSVAPLGLHIRTPMSSVFALPFLTCLLALMRTDPIP